MVYLPRMSCTEIVLRGQVSARAPSRRRTLINTSAAFLLAVFVWASANAAQPRPFTQGQNQPPGKDEVVRLKTALVHIHAVVTDKQGKLVEELKKEDFELLDQGQRQDIGFFTEERIGGTPAEQPASGKNPIEAGKPAERSFTPLRSIVLFVDTLHLSAPNVLRAKQTLKQFVDERMTDRDVVLVVTSSGLFSGFEQFTQDRQLLHYLIDRITPWQASLDSRFTPYLAAMVKHGDNDALNVAIEVLQAEEGPSLAGLPRNMIRQIVEGKAGEVLAYAEHRRRSLLSVLKAVVEGLAGLPGQRLLMFLSDGFTMMDQSGWSGTGDLQSAISKAVRSGVRIYSLDAKGLQPPSEFDASRRGVGGNSRTIGLLSSYMSASEGDLQDGMNALAADTGGKFFHNTNDLKGSLQKAVDDNRVYYVLAYYPSDLKDSRKFRRITVRVKNHPEYKVRAQSGYLISDFRKEEQKETARSPQQRLLQAIASPLPMTSIRVGAWASYLEVDSDAAQVSLQAWIDGAGLTYRAGGGRFQIELEVATVVYDRRGQPVTTRSETIRGNLRVEEVEIAKRDGLRYATRLTVKPGHYQVRIGISEKGAEHIGTAITWVEVPTIGRDKLALSNILLSEGSNEAEKRLTASSGGGISPWLGVRYFTRGTFLVYQLMIYNAPSKDPESELVIQSEITRGGEVVYQSQPTPIASRVVGKEKKGILLGGQIKLALEPGIYELRISIGEARSKRKAQQAVTFGIAR